MKVDGIYLNENISFQIRFFQRVEINSRYTDALDKVVESLILEEEMPPDEYIPVATSLLDLRRALKSMIPPEALVKEDDW